MRAYSLDLREKIVESVKKGVPKAESARRFGVDRATVKRYCKLLDERGTLEPGKAPGRAPKLDEKARKLLVEDIEQRPWATHAQRAEFSKIKHILRTMSARTKEALIEAMGLALRAVSDKDAGGFFASCGYRTPEQQL